MQNACTTGLFNYFSRPTFYWDTLLKAQKQKIIVKAIENIYLKNKAMNKILAESIFSDLPVSL